MNVILLDLSAKHINLLSIKFMTTINKINLMLVLFQFKLTC